MARPERNNVDYFPLYVDNGRKMYFIEHKYGNDGYASWIKILSELGKADYHYLNLKDETQLMYLSALCKINVEMLNNIINDLVKLGEFDKILWKENILFSQKFIESIEDAYKKRNNNPPTLQSLGILLKSLGILKQSFNILKSVSNPQRIGKDRIAKDRIEENIPTFEEFKLYAIEKCKIVNLSFNELKLKLKYDSWVENNWKDGNHKKVKNWKSKLTNTIGFMFDEKNDIKKQKNDKQKDQSSDFSNGL